MFVERLYQFCLGMWLLALILPYLCLMRILWRFNENSKPQTYIVNPPAFGICRRHIFGLQKLAIWMSSARCSSSSNGNSRANGHKSFQENDLRTLRTRLKCQINLSRAQFFSSPFGYLTASLWFSPAFQMYAATTEVFGLSTSAVTNL